MATYNVVMGQGVSVADLTGDSLATGGGLRGDRIQSCSAIIMANTNTHAAGLYHFPEGDIDTDQRSRNVLGAMQAAIQPNQASLIYGISSVTDTGHSAMKPYADAAADKLMKLHSHLQGCVAPGCQHIMRIPCRSGYASVSLNGGQFVISTNTVGQTTDLRNVAEGVYPLYRVYRAL